MKTYAQISGAFFCLLAAVQLTRAVLGWPVLVDDVSIPVWASACAFVVASALAAWAFRTARHATP
ncbi:MAG TPA: hypothetical protein PK948_06425 [Gemmatimonadales bacterium]|jgi:hypothetical protein|nr:hypothetical protein [Gemmatimonadales bacterium]